MRWSETSPRWPLVCLALSLAVAVGAAGCSGGEEPGPSSQDQAATPSSDSGADAPAPVAAPWVADWEDPEPEGAQELAEKVLNAAWNRDKTTQLNPPATTRLTMSITTLVDRTTGIEGFHTELAAADTSIDDRLARLDAEVTATEVTIRLPGSVLFDFDSEAIRPDAERTLSEVVGVLEAYAGRPVRIEGHTDSIGTAEYNRDLSERRAGSVRDWLVAHRIPAAALRAIGHGESRPVADNATAECRQRNRRVEIVIEKKD
ncbi:MAG: OmpA family protein [bacterium]|nr:OmpA family protein [bacterium]